MRLFFIVLFFITALIASAIARSELRSNNVRVPKNLLSTHRNVHPYPLSSFRRRIRAQKEVKHGLIDKRSAPPYSQFDNEIDSPKEFDDEYQQYQQNQIQDQDQDLQQFDRGLSNNKQEQEQNQNEYHQQERNQQLPVIQWRYADKNLDQEEDGEDQIQEEEIPETQWNYPDETQAQVQDGMERQRGVRQNQWNQVDQNEDLDEFPEQRVRQNEWDQVNQNEDQIDDLDQVEQQQGGNRIQWQYADLDEDKDDNLNQVQQHRQYPEFPKNENQGQENGQSQNQFPRSWQIRNQVENEDEGFGSQNEWQSPEKLDSQNQYQQAQIKKDTSQWTYHPEVNQYGDDYGKSLFPK